MPAHKPEECDLLLFEIIETGDLDAALALYESDARTALITYWRGGPADTYYRCVDYEDADFRSTGHFCWQLDSE